MPNVTPPEFVTAQPEQEFFYDDFFVNPEDCGIAITLKVRDREVPVTVRPGITIAEREAAVGRSMIRKMVDGKIKTFGIDETKLSGELMALAITTWPFKYRDGKLVPITGENCMKMLVGAADQILVLIAQGREAKAEELNPFALN